MSVCKAYRPAERRDPDILSFTHHREVMGLDTSIPVPGEPPDREWALSQAVVNGWSTAMLRRFKLLYEDTLSEGLVNGWDVLTCRALALARLNDANDHARPVYMMLREPVTVTIDSDRIVLDRPVTVDFPNGAYQVIASLVFVAVKPPEEDPCTDDA
jgi:hypothetical protein